MLPLRLLLIFILSGFACAQEAPQTTSQEPHTDSESDPQEENNSETDTESETFDGEDWSNCPEMCSTALDCDGLLDEVQFLGTTQEECESQCLQMDWSMSQCTRTAKHCDEFFGCTSTSTEEDTCICPGVCSLSMECSLTDDVDNCSDVCASSLAAGEVYGAGMGCWKTAVEESDCDIAQQCPQLY